MQDPPLLWLHPEDESEAVRRMKAWWRVVMACNAHRLPMWCSDYSLAASGSLPGHSSERGMNLYPMSGNGSRLWPPRRRSYS